MIALKNKYLRINLIKENNYTLKIKIMQVLWKNLLFISLLYNMYSKKNMQIPEKLEFIGMLPSPWGEGVTAGDGWGGKVVLHYY